MFVGNGSFQSIDTTVRAAIEYTRPAGVPARWVRLRLAMVWLCDEAIEQQGFIRKWLWVVAVWLLYRLTKEQRL